MPIWMFMSMIMAEPGQLAEQLIYPIPLALFDISLLRSPLADLRSDMLAHFSPPRDCASDPA